MGSIVLVAVVALGAYAWVRATRKRRQLWLRRLNLPGVWLEQTERGATYEFVGNLSQGTFRMTEKNHDRRKGEWQLTGRVLKLMFDDGQAQRHDLTFYDGGKIGLEKAPGQRVYLQKTPANVVPLHKRA